MESEFNNCIHFLRSFLMPVIKRGSHPHCKSVRYLSGPPGGGPFQFSLFRVLVVLVLALVKISNKIWHRHMHHRGRQLLLAKVKNADRQNWYIHIESGIRRQTGKIAIFKFAFWAWFIRPLWVKGHTFYTNFGCHNLQRAKKWSYLVRKGSNDL